MLSFTDGLYSHTQTYTHNQSHNIQILNTTRAKKTKVGLKKWKLNDNKNKNDKKWEDLLYEAQIETLPMACAGCERTSAWCNCTLEDVIQEQDYTIAVKIEEDLRTRGVKGATSSIATHCPIKSDSTDSFNCMWPATVNITTIPAFEICDGTPGCPNGRDEAWCRPDQLLLLPVVAIFLAASLGAWCTDREETEARNSSGTAVETLIVKVLKALLRSTTSTTPEEEKEEVEAVDQLRRSDQVELVKGAHKMNRTSRKRIFQKTLASVFKSESEKRREKLRAIKEADVSTKLKEEVFSEVGDSWIHRCKSKINISRGFRKVWITLSSLKDWVGLLFAEQKDIATFETIW